MRTACTGCGTALVTPFTRRRGRRGAPSGASRSGRSTRASTSSCRAGRPARARRSRAAERRRVVELVVEEAAGRVPVLAGAGGYDTQEVIEAAREMQRAGAAGLLSVTPYYNKPTPEGLFRTTSAIAEATPLPIVVYNVPGPDGLQRRSRDARAPRRRSRTSSAVKEASGNMTQICEVCRPCRPEFIVLSGDDALTLPAMAVGARGIISVASNEVPAEMAQMVEAAEAQRLRVRARDPRAAAAADARELRRVEPDPGEVRDGADGPARGELPAADGAAARRDAREARARRSRASAPAAVPARERPLARGAPRARRARSSAGGAAADREEARASVRRAARRALGRRGARGRARSPAPPTGWRVNAWVKQGILLGFRHGDVVDVSVDHGRWPFFDKDTLPLQAVRRGGGRAHRAGRLLGP